MSKTVILKIFLLLFAIAYAIVRYGLVKGIPPENWATFVTNKAAALAAVIYYSIGLCSRTDNPSRNSFIKDGMVLGLLHMILSLVVIKQDYLGYLFQDNGKMTVMGEFAFLFGGLLIAFAYRQIITAQLWTFSAIALWWVILIAHIVAIGWEKWVQWCSNPSFAIPISFVSFTIAVIAGLLMLVRHNKTSLPETT